MASKGGESAPSAAEEKQKPLYDFGTDIFQQFGPVPYLNVNFRQSKNYTLSTHFTVQPDMERFLQAIEEDDTEIIILPKLQLWPSISTTHPQYPQFSFGTGIFIANQNFKFQVGGAALGIEFRPDQWKDVTTSITYRTYFEKDRRVGGNANGMLFRSELEALAKYKHKQNLHLAAQIIPGDRIALGCRWWPWYETSKKYNETEGQADPTVSPDCGSYITGKIDSDLDIGVSMSVPMNKSYVNTRLWFSCGINLRTGRPRVGAELAFGILGVGYYIPRGLIIGGQSVNEFVEVMEQIQEAENRRR